MEHISIQRTHVSRETWVFIYKLFNDNEDKLHTYIDKLMWWNKTVNLFSRKIKRSEVQKHVEHSLLLASYLKDYKKIVDTGTGGGLPGIPLAIINPEQEFLLNDIVMKKGIAIKDMYRYLGLNNVTVDIKDIAELDYDADVLISKHAFKINDLLKRIEGKNYKELFLLKGSNFDDELVGIEEPLFIKVYELNSIDPFYTDKAIVNIRFNE